MDVPRRSVLDWTGGRRKSIIRVRFPGNKAHGKLSVGIMENQKTTMLEELKEQVCEANLKLVSEGLVIQTWGNVSGIDRDSGHVVIKASGLSYDGMKPSQMVVVSLKTGVSC